MSRDVPRSALTRGLARGMMVALALFITSAGTRGQDVPVGLDRWNRAALEWIRLLQDGDFGEAGARVDPEVPEGVMGPGELETLWSQVSAQLGTLSSLAPGRISEQGQYHLVDLPASFESQALTLRVVLTDSLLVSGFFLRPLEPPPYDPPAYVDESRFHEVEITVGGEPWPLPGTLTLPNREGPVPGAVLVHGSGPNDRDETVGRSRPFRDLAWGLGSRGIAVLRYDKRTKAHGTRLPPDIGLEEEVVADALAALELVRSRPEIDAERVFLLGHSLGGMLVPTIAARDGSVAGIGILAAPARPFFDVLLGQLAYVASLEEDPGSPTRSRLDSLIALVEEVESGGAPEGEPVLGAPPSYWREVADLDPVTTATALPIPILVLQGGRDYQSTPADYARWVEALEGKEGFVSHLYPALNHLFAPGAGTATPEEYAAGESHVHEEVILGLARWIQGAGG